jgi:uncharacterized cysteine cluster protein YcgN (CxxCxxCC family)
MNVPPNDGAAWEDRCRRCGRCCFHKIEEEDGTVFVTPVPCRFLDVVERTCKIYERRFAVNPACIRLTPELVAQLPWLPRDCGYRPEPPDDGT